MRFTIEHGTFSYKKGGREVLHDINLAAESGDLIAVLGPNGAGKTTLLRCAMGFLKWNAGASMIDGRDIAKLPYHELWRNIAYVPQSRSAATSLTVRDTVLLGRTGRLGVFNKPAREDIMKADEVMERLNILSLADKPSMEISGGELQMTLIARALASEPGMLILDEPESNLDFRNQLIVLETMTRLASEGIICLFNTHYPAHAMRRANKALLLARSGEYIFDSVEQVVTEENIERAFGVKAVISEIETPVSVTRDVIPVMLSNTDGRTLSNASTAIGSTKTLATISIIAPGMEEGERINALLHEYRDSLIGRMGMPYKEAGVNIINVNLNATNEDIRALTRKLEQLHGVSVKATFAIAGEGEKHE